MESLETIVCRRARSAGTLLVVLQEIQDAMGHVPSAAVPIIAAHYNVTVAEVEGVLDFYDELRRAAPGRHRVRLCRGDSCAALGAGRLEGAVHEHLQDCKLERSGQSVTTADGRLTVDTVYCLGNCALAPSVQIDGEAAGRLTPETLLQRLRELERD